MNANANTVPTLSASRLSAYAQCPQVYLARYGGGPPEPPSAEMLLGTSVHRGIEMAYRGRDGQAAFFSRWDAAKKELATRNIAVDSQLDAQGMRLVSVALALGLDGLPEAHFREQYPGLDVPLVGVIDLWGRGKDHGILADWKCSGRPGAFTPRDKFQAALYSVAFCNDMTEHGGRGEYPRFLYVKLCTQGPPVVQMTEGSLTTEEIEEVFEGPGGVIDLYRGMVLGDWVCRCGKHRPKRGGGA